MTRVGNAIVDCLGEHLISAEAVIQRTWSLAAIEATTRGLAPAAPEAVVTAQVHVPLPDLGRFDQLLSAATPESPVSVFFA